MKDVSIEYAHIYTNNKIGEEQETSLKILQQIKEDVGKSSISLVVLVDDYSFPDPSFNYDDFLSWLSGKGFKPDVVFRESQLIPLCDEVLSKLTDRNLKDQLTDYIKIKKYPCSLFISAWYLLRLGYLEDKKFDKKLSAKKLINILPESFKPFEDKALEIIAATPRQEALKQIEYKFMKGRLIA